jgi:predicted KAP-like P-loop ATPase
LGAINDALSLLRGLVATPQAELTPDKIEVAITDVKDFIKPVEQEKIPEQLRAFNKEFEALLDEAKIEKLIVLIDDLDRCLPKTAIETLEALRLFVFTPKTAFVIAADEAMIEYAVKQHFPDLPETSGPSSYARNYLEKLIQVPFRIPALGLTETQIYIALILIQAELGEDNSDFHKILAKARECLSQPWKSTVLDHQTAEACLTKGGETSSEISRKVVDAITLSLQISGILTEGTRGNPRQIKRFLNSILLRNEIAEARGLGSEIKKPILAKIMLAEAFRSSFYGQLTRWADSAINGKSREMKALEDTVSAKSDSAEKTRRDTGNKGSGHER